MATGSQSYRPDPFRQEAAKAQIAAHQEVDLLELSTIIDPELIFYIDEYQTNAESIIGNELPPDIDLNIGNALRNNTSIYDDEVEDLLLEDQLHNSLMQLPPSEERSAAIRARRSVIILSLLALKQSIARHPSQRGR